MDLATSRDSLTAIILILLQSNKLDNIIFTQLDDYNFYKKQLDDKNIMTSLVGSLDRTIVVMQGPRYRAVNYIAPDLFPVVYYTSKRFYRPDFQTDFLISQLNLLLAERIKFIYFYH